MEQTATILFVDDEPDLEALVLQKFRRQIREGAVTFVFAHDGVEALESIAANPQVDMVVSDINMPRMDGLSQLAKLDGESAREEIRDIINEIISLKNVVLSISEQEELLEDICNDVLGYGPLEPLLARDDIADIMVNGALIAKGEVVTVNGRYGIRIIDIAATENRLAGIERRG